MEHSQSISVLVSARRNSKYLAKFLFGFFERTADWRNMEILVMLNEHDDWNRELVDFFMPFGVRFFHENEQLGRAGLHEYFNKLYLPATGAWIVYFCEDHFITKDGWDREIRSMIKGWRGDGDTVGKKFPLDPNEPWVLVPKFDNVGAMNHVLSHGFIKALGNKLGRHGWIDSYINDLAAVMPDRVIRFDEPFFHDFTHDQPNPMSEAHVQSVSTKKGEALPDYKDPIVQKRIKEDQQKLIRAIKTRHPKLKIPEAKNGLPE